MKIALDMHIEYVFDKLLSRVGRKLEEFPYYSPQDLEQAFVGVRPAASFGKASKFFGAGSRGRLRPASSSATSQPKWVI
jgi:hypothetical protein